jgi:hypothetical protein
LLIEKDFFTLRRRLSGFAAAASLGLRGIRATRRQAQPGRTAGESMKNGNFAVAVFRFFY